MKCIIRFVKSYLDKAIIVLFFIALFFRIYKLPEYATFLGDQGRDAIIIKDIVTLKHFTAIGPVSSIGRVFLGPFFYYFMAPWLALFFLNPIGLAFGTAIINSLGVIIVYFVLKLIFNKQIGLIGSIFYTFSYTLIEFSRFSWNPNILPLFVFIYLYLFFSLIEFDTVKKTKEKRTLLFNCVSLSMIHISRLLALFTGMFFAFCMQLHYSVVFLGISSGIVWVYQMTSKMVRKDNFSTHFKKIASYLTVYHNDIFSSLFVLMGFIIGYIPLILFDLRHQFLNLNNLFKMFSEEKTHIASFTQRIVSSFGYLITFIVGFPISGTIGMIIVIVLVGVFVLKEKFNTKSFVISILFIGSLLGTAWFMDARIPHYYNVMYPFIIILFAYFLYTIWNIKAVSWIGQVGVISLICLYIFINLSKTSFIITHQGSNQIGRAKKVAKIIYDDIPHNTTFTLTTLPHRYDDYSYRYFLEIWNKYPTSKEVRKHADLLYVVCPEKCTPIGDPGWDVAFFAPNKIDKQWTVDHVTIYRLSR